MFRRILVATDLTDQSATALKFARRLAEYTSARIIALHVVAMPTALRTWAGPSFRADLANYQSLIDRQLEAARERLELVARKAGLEVDPNRVIARAGTPASVISAVADEVNADLIVVGRGKGGRLGPVAEHTVRLVGRTVMVAPVKLPRSSGRRLPIPARRAPRRLAA